MSTMSVGPSRSTALLLGIGGASLLLYGVVLALSFRFDADTQGGPIPAVVALFGLATLGWLAAQACVWKDRREDRGTLWIVLGFSAAYRLVLLPSQPILEIDFYRYLWDGRVAAQGFSPYRYSPFQVKDVANEEPPSTDLVVLYKLSQQSDSVWTILKRVHHAGVPTVYPPASQLVFAAAALATPASAPVWWHILVLKALLVGFDLATLGVLVALLRRFQLPATWCLAYGWCPLVMKEIANSGHLDSIAVFLTTLAVFWLVKAGQSASPMRWTVAGLATLGLAVLAKSYPVVLLPVVAAYLAGRWRWRGVAALAIVPVVVLAGYAPFLGGAEEQAEEVKVHHPGTGLSTFLTEWESNDFLFRLTYQNLRSPRQDRPGAWWVVVPKRWREGWNDALPDVTALNAKTDAAFVLTQGLMGLVLLGFCTVLAWRTIREPEPESLVRSAFLSMAVGWLLSSAQNPWYLLWSLPLMVFARQRSWFLLPGLAWLYYLGFWLTDSWQELERNLVWLEYVPFFVAMAVESWWLRGQPMPWKRVLRVAGAVAITLAVGLAVLHATRPRVKNAAAGRKELALSDPSKPVLDHGTFDALLKKYVDAEGMVAYRAWKANADDVKALDDYLARLGAVDLDLPAPREARLAFWINAYNALTLKGILQVYPTKSIRDHTPLVGGYNIWKDLLQEIDGRNYSLDDIEHQVLRKMDEPRIHFTLVCASKGCPPLRPEAYTAGRMEEQLRDNARRFFARPTNFRADEADRSVAITELLSPSPWFGGDFAKTSPEVVRALRTYFPQPEKLGWLDAPDLIVDFLPYDWSLNDQAIN
ncbi:MAG: DUF547 domain-containing protein [Gemmataceae bacterium]|nr:DUF547 domain-containing protein [Gemmataceae bacterium]